MKCRGIGPHLAAMGKSHEFSRVATGTWCLFSRYGGDGHLKLGFFSAKSGNQLSSPDDMGCPDFSSCCFTEIDVPIDFKWLSQGISGLL